MTPFPNQNRRHSWQEILNTFERRLCATIGQEE